MNQEDKNIIPFGKHKGKPVEVLIADDQYREWLMAQSWFRERFGNLYQVVINYGQEQHETPEHNALQVLFLDEGFRKKFVEAFCKISQALVHTEQPLFEQLGIDAEFDAEWGTFDYGFCRAFGCGQTNCKDCLKYIDQGYKEKQRRRQPKTGGSCYFLIEIKPTLGDEFPAVLRQLQKQRDLLRNLHHNGHGRRQQILLIGEFTARGANVEQVRVMFASSQIKIITMAEIGGGAGEVEGSVNLLPPPLK